MREISKNCPLVQKRTAVAKQTLVDPQVKVGQREAGKQSSFFSFLNFSGPKEVTFFSKTVKTVKIFENCKNIFIGPFTSVGCISGIFE